MQISERRSTAPEGRRGGAILLVICGAVCLGLVFLAVALLAACSASVSSAIRADGSATMSIQADVTEAVAAKLRKLGTAAGGTGQTAPFFDQGAIRTSIAARPYLSLNELSSPSLDSLRLSVDVRSLRELAEAPDVKGSGLVVLTKGPSWTEYRFRLDRGDIKTLRALLPGIDPALMDALAPPAFDTDPVTAADYRTMLRSLFGEKAMPSIDAAAVTLAVSVPGTILDSGGGSLSGSTLTAKIPMLQILVLERPVEVWVRWAN
jgi:hypothetical protein